MSAATERDRRLSSSGSGDGRRVRDLVARYAETLLGNARVSASALDDALARDPDLARAVLDPDESVFLALTPRAGMCQHFAAFDRLTTCAIFSLFCDRWRWAHPHFCSNAFCARHGLEFVRLRGGLLSHKMDVFHARCWATLVRAADAPCSGGLSAVPLHAFAERFLSSAQRVARGEPRAPVIIDLSALADDDPAPVRMTTTPARRRRRVDLTALVSDDDDAVAVRPPPPPLPPLTFSAEVRGVTRGIDLLALVSDDDDDEDADSGGGDSASAEDLPRAPKRSLAEYLTEEMAEDGGDGAESRKAPRTDRRSSPQPVVAAPPAPVVEVVDAAPALEDGELPPLPPLLRAMPSPHAVDVESVFELVGGGWLHRVRFTGGDALFRLLAGEPLGPLARAADQLGTSPVMQAQDMPPDSDATLAQLLQLVAPADAPRRALEKVRRSRFDLDPLTLRCPADAAVVLFVAAPFRVTLDAPLDLSASGAGPGDLNWATHCAPVLDAAARTLALAPGLHYLCTRWPVNLVLECTTAGAPVSLTALLPPAAPGLLPGAVPDRVDFAAVVAQQRERLLLEEQQRQRLVADVEARPSRPGLALSSARLAFQEMEEMARDMPLGSSLLASARRVDAALDSICAQARLEVVGEVASRQRRLVFPPTTDYMAFVGRGYVVVVAEGVAAQLAIRSLTHEHRDALPFAPCTAPSAEHRERFERFMDNVAAYSDARASNNARLEAMARLVGDAQELWGQPSTTFTLSFKYKFYKSTSS